VDDGAAGRGFGDPHPVTWNPDEPFRILATGDFLCRYSTLSHDGAFLAAGGSRKLTVWDVAAGEKRIDSGKHRCGVEAVAFAPGRPLLASGGTNGVVFFWDAVTGKDVARYDWKTGPVKCLGFAPDGLRCAAGGASGTVAVWDVDV